MLEHQAVLTEDGVEQMLALAEGLRTSNGGVLDESAIQAVAEATGAPVDYVRLALKLRTEKAKTNALGNLRAQFLTLEQDVRRYVTSGLAATFCALLGTIENKLNHEGLNYGVFGMLALVALSLGLYTVSVAKDSRTGAIAGAVFGGGYIAMQAVFSFVFRLPVRIESGLLIPFTIGGALGGLALQKIVDKYRGNLGLKDPAKERQELLSQLVQLQDKLRSGEQAMTFLSIDIVGSTRMKEISDPLSVEFTFNEYHQFVERITKRHGGRIHSTAGDGVICAFEHPVKGLNAAKNIQTGVIELNTFRNKIGVPIVLRCALHTGAVVAPQAGDITSLNFAHVIDIASHLQKETPPGAVTVSDAAAAHIPGGPAAVGSGRVEIMGVRGSVWMARFANSAKILSGPPGLPE